MFVGYIIFLFFNFFELIKYVHILNNVIYQNKKKYIFNIHICLSFFNKINISKTVQNHETRKKL